MSVEQEENNFRGNGNGYPVLGEPVIHKLPKSIAMAINGIMGDIKMLKKEDENKFQNYSYASIDNFLKAVNPLCAKHGLIIIMDEESCEITKDGTKNPWIHIVYKFILSHANGDTWLYTARRNMFVAMTGGQSMGSSMSYCLKQFMRSLFQISTGEKDDLDGHNQNFDVQKKEELNAQGKPKESKRVQRSLLEKARTEKKKTGFVLEDTFDDKKPKHTTHRRIG